MNVNLFLTKWSEASGGRLDPSQYHFERREAMSSLKMSNRKLMSLKHVASFSKSVTSDNKDNLPYVGLENIESNTGIYLKTNEREKFGSALKFSSGQVLFPKLRPYLNKVYFAEFDGLCSTEFHLLDSQIVLNKYLAIFLRSNLVVSQTKHLMTGNTLPRLQTEDIQNLLIPILSYDEQSKIINKMDMAYLQKEQAEREADKLLQSIDDYLLHELGIEATKDNDKEITKHTFLRKWSELSGGRFDPDFHSPRYYAFHFALQNGKYTTINLREIAEIFQGVGRDLTDNPEYTLLKVKNIKQGNIIDFEDIEHINDVPKNKLLHVGDIISPFIGEAIKQFKFSLFKNEENKFTVDNNTGVIRINVSDTSSEFVCEVLNSCIVKWQIEQQIGGGGVPFIGTSGAKNIKIPHPPIDKQNEIAEHISGIRIKAKALREKAVADFEKTKAEIEEMILGESL